MSSSSPTKKQEKGSRLNALQLSPESSISNNNNNVGASELGGNDSPKANSPLNSSLRSTSPTNASSSSTSAAAAAVAAAQQNQQQQQQSVTNGSLFTPKSIVFGIFKFVFICLVVAFSIWATKLVYCSTTFVSRPQHWLQPNSSGKPFKLSPVQEKFAKIDSYGERFQYCLMTF
jgi:hypothetical protein